MRNLKGPEWETLEQNLVEMIRQAIALKLSLEKMSVDDFGPRQIQRDMHELAGFVSDTTGDMGRRLEMLNGILGGLHEHAIN